MKKRIIITGASKGIGRELTRLFLKDGHQVFVMARTESALEELALDFKDEDFRYAPLDITDPYDLENILDYIYDWDTVDVLYNNAGYLVNKPFLDLQKEDFLKCWEVNFLAPAQIIQTLKDKWDKDSHIVNISTMGAVQGSMKFPGLAAYSSSKAALTNLTELLAEEFKENGPKVNSVALGAVQTEMLEAAFPGYKAPLSAAEMASYLMDFGLNGHKYFNGKILQASVSTP